MAHAELQAMYFADFCCAFQVLIMLESKHRQYVDGYLFAALAALAMNYSVAAIPGIEKFSRKCSLLSTMNVLGEWMKASQC